MKNVYVIRTAVVASLVSGVIGLSSLGLQGEEAHVAPITATLYIPAGYELQPGVDEGQVFEYY